MAAQFDRFRKHPRNLTEWCLYASALQKLWRALASAGAGAYDESMEKPNVRGPSPSRKAHIALREKLNRPDKPPPLLRTPINSRGRKRHR
jgi:hypothetical protein